MDRNVWIAVCIGAGLLWSTAYAGSVLVPGIAGDIQLEVESFQERKFSTILRQEYDYSCGSAALASLLSYHYDHPVTEQEVFLAMLDLADAEKVRKEGFSMLDMKRYLQTRGFRADGFRLDIDGLRERVALPLIVLMTIDGYRHFVVVKGISDREVLIGDPTRGMMILDHDRFLAQWNGIAFVIRNHVELGRASFRERDQWPEIAGAPLRQGIEGDQIPMGLDYVQWPHSLEW
ncbi:MAG: C39 family peptidase [Marinobacter sp.]|uniref:C39 family peptidase n=1 Tax=Marinobacter sp. TaxID=50741 RepID=UPI00299F091E|nr:C39 family peptidase [Marinobacter sp.]MDX1757204.1 C39 family peptidase [Marinobacter sp.]